MEIRLAGVNALGILPLGKSVRFLITSTLHKSAHFYNTLYMWRLTLFPRGKLHVGNFSTW